MLLVLLCCTMVFTAGPNYELMMMRYPLPPGCCHHPTMMMDYHCRLVLPSDGENEPYFHRWLVTRTDDGNYFHRWF